MGFALHYSKSVFISELAFMHIKEKASRVTQQVEDERPTVTQTVHLS